MHTFRLIVIFLAIAFPSVSLGFDWGSFGRGFNSAQEGNKNASERFVEYFAKKVDNGEEIFVTESTRKNRIVDRFEQAMKDSGISPSYTYQATSPIKIVIDKTTFYEQWGTVLFRNKNRGGVEELSAQRYFFFCDKGIVGNSGSAYFDMNEGVRTVNRIYLLTVTFNIVDYHGPGKSSYESVCQTSNPQVEEAPRGTTPIQELHMK